MTNIYFVRHAQTDYSNPVDKDRPLTAEGMQERYLAKTYMEEQGLLETIKHVYSSDFKRAVDTVLPIAEQLGITVEALPHFREWTLIADEEEYYAVCERAWKDFDYRYKTCETLREVQQRNLHKLAELVREHEGESLVIGTHGTALSTMLHYYRPEYGYRELLQIMEYKPWIVRFQYEGEQLVKIEECFRNDLNIEKST